VVEHDHATARGEEGVDRRLEGGLGRRAAAARSSMREVHQHVVGIRIAQGDEQRAGRIGNVIGGDLGNRVRRRIEGEAARGIVEGRGQVARLAELGVGELVGVHLVAHDQDAQRPVGRELGGVGGSRTAHKEREEPQSHGHHERSQLPSLASLPG
jgi:hypothetical protein